MWLIAGLGNPGPKYELTRHNLGFLAVDALLESIGQSQMKTAFSSLTCRADVGGQPAVILKPQTFMNKSGLAVQQASSFHQIPRNQIIVVHDELDLPLGDIRVKLGGGNGGHNGLRDISQALGPDFLRVRLGIGRPQFKGTESDYVLAPFTNSDIKIVEDLLPRAVLAITTLITEGLEKCQQKCQTVKK
jgi:PTH1 family peptidyl-tRNA hydrolase